MSAESAESAHSTFSTLNRFAARSRALILPALIFMLVGSAAAGFIIPVLGALVAGGEIALEIWSRSSGPTETDPTSLWNAISHVKKMQSSGASNSQISSYLSGVVDRRLIAPNREWSPADGLITPLDSWGKGQRFERHLRDRNSLGLPARRIAASPDIERANWAWAHGVGNCEEAASVTFSILDRSGIPARYIRSSAGSGHAFSVIGLAAGANINDPSTWGPDAFVVDGWTGSAYTANQALESRWHLRGGAARLTDATEEVHKPEMDNRWNEMANKGVLSLVVVDGAGHRVSGARIKVATSNGTFTSVTTGGGTALMDLPTGDVTISVDPPENSGLHFTGATAKIEERVFTQLTVKLPNRPAPISIAPPPAADALHGSGSMKMAPVEVSGDATIISQQGDLKLDITLDPVSERFHGTLSGGLAAVVGHHDGTKDDFKSTFTGDVRGSFHGNRERGSLSGNATMTEIGGGAVGSGSASVAGQISGSVTNGNLICDIHIQDQTFSFRFAVK